MVGGIVSSAETRLRSPQILQSSTVPRMHRDISQRDGAAKYLEGLTQEGLKEGVSSRLNGGRHGPSKTTFKAKAPERSPSRNRSRWAVIVAGEHRVCGPWRTGSKLTHFRQRRWQTSLPR